MDALLGKITEITQVREAGPRGLARFSVRFRPVCLIPTRAPVPEHLRHVELSAVREVADLREIGRQGDSFVTTPAEAAPWLYPLTAEPAVTHGQFPKALTVSLRRWPTEPGELVCRADGRETRHSFERVGEGFETKVEPAALYGAAPGLPCSIEFVHQNLRASAVCLAQTQPCYAKRTTPTGVRHRLEAAWYAMEVIGETHGGWVCWLAERGRGLDVWGEEHRTSTEALKDGGYRDHLKVAGHDVLARASMRVSSFQQDADRVVLSMAGSVEGGKVTQTAVEYALREDLPLVAIRRSVPAVEDEPHRDEPVPGERVKSILPVESGFQVALPVRGRPVDAGRFLSLDNDRLVSERFAVERRPR